MAFTAGPEHRCLRWQNSSLLTYAMALTATALFADCLFGMQGMVFDYYVDDATCSMVPWENKVPSFSYMPDSFSSLFVPTVDTTRLTYFLDTLIAKKHFVMFVGNTGTGCSTHLMAVWLNILDSCHALCLICCFVRMLPATSGIQQ